MEKEQMLESLNNAWNNVNRISDNILKIIDTSTDKVLLDYKYLKTVYNFISKIKEDINKIYKNNEETFETDDDLNHLHFYTVDLIDTLLDVIEYLLDTSNIIEDHFVSINKSKQTGNNIIK